MESPDALRKPHAFPTRRSSDLAERNATQRNATHGHGRDRICAAAAGRRVGAQVGVGVRGYRRRERGGGGDRKSTRLNSSHVKISYAVFCLKKKIMKRTIGNRQQ